MKENEENIHLIQLKAGNLQSFKALYSLYYEKVYFFCLSFVKSPKDAEEITSDVFVRIWEKRSILDPSYPLKPLLFKITKDLTWNFLKKTARKTELRERFVENYVWTSSYDTESEVLFSEYMEIIDQALDKLTPKQQKIFTLRYFKGKELSQIASELQISKNTVKVHLINSKRQVLNYLRIHADMSFFIALATFWEIIFSKT